jgi:hypothetical protein
MSAVSSEVGDPAASWAAAAAPIVQRWSAAKLAQLGYAVAALAIAIGWLVTRYYVLVDPMNGLGYWLGIVGASLMAALLLYPVRKRIRFLHRLGATKHWFRTHMVLGVLGPILILYHSNFQFGSFNSNVALLCTLIVAGSGLVGRYFYVKIYRDLDGHRTTLQDLIAKARITREEQARVSVLVPNLLERMSEFDGVVLTPPHGFLAGLLLPLKLAVTTRLARIRLTLYARSQLAMQAKRSPIIRAERKRLQKTTSRFIAQHLRQIRRVAELGSYERLFSLWHVFHLPFFYILVVTALVHVLAVHMY